MIEFATNDAFTVTTNEVVIETPEANTALANALEPHVVGDTNVIFTARCTTDAGHVQLVNAINQWSVMMATNTGSALTYADTSGTVILTAASNTAVTTATANTTYEIFDTDTLTYGGPPRVGVTFTTNSATTNLTWTDHEVLIRPIHMEAVRTGGFTVWKPRELTDEEKAEQARRHAEYERQCREREALRKVADSKAEVLLRKVLTAKQRAELDEFGHFHVWSKDGFKYRISRGKAHNVKRVCPDTGKVEKSYCIYPRISVPDSDAMLAQKLLLEGDPERFLRTANVSDR